MNFDNLMEQLRGEYLATIPEKIQMIIQFYNANDAHGVREIFHKLKGTGGTYGVPEISTFGEILENFCKAQPSNLKAVVPDAIELLKKIHASRLKNEAFDINADARFQYIRGLL